LRRLRSLRKSSSLCVSSDVVWAAAIYENDEWIKAEGVLKKAVDV
jgi:hypothetical protein